MVGRVVLFLAATLAVIEPAHAQFGGFGKRLLDKAKEQVEGVFKAELGAVGPCLGSAPADSPSDCMEAAFAASIAGSFGRMLRGEALELHQGALLSALTSGEDAGWTTGDGNVSGEVKVVETEDAENPAAPAETAPGATGETLSADTKRPCRTIEQIVKDANGREETKTIRACMGPNGWELS